jgi:diacylglycerol kinase (ATP)
VVRGFSLFPGFPNFGLIANGSLFAVADNGAFHQLGIVKDLILFGNPVIHIPHQVDIRVLNLPVNEVVNAIAYVPDRPKIGYIPTGTTNDLAHSLKIPKNVKKAVKIILDGKYVSHDIFRVNDKYGIYVCAFGLFTGSSYGATSVSKKKFGRLAYFKYGIQELFGAKPFLVTLDFGENTFTGNYALGIIANSRYVAGYKINKMATCNDGYVNVILVNDKVKKGVSLGALLRIAKIFLFGMNSIKKTKNCIILKLNKFKMTLPEDAQINLDGEAGFKGSFDFEVLKQHIDIFVK